MFAGEDETLLIRRNAFLVLNFGLDVVDGIAGLDLKGDGLASNCDKLVCARVAIDHYGDGLLTSLDEDLHDCGRLMRVVVVDVLKQWRR